MASNIDLRQRSLTDGEGIPSSNRINNASQVFAGKILPIDFLNCCHLFRYYMKHTIGAVA
jgi:hypothetical protein